MHNPLFSYPDDDEIPYLSWYKDIFSSVFVATNPFIKIPVFSVNASGDWIPDNVLKLAKQRGLKTAVSWQEIADLCGFPSIEHVNRALRLTGSKRISEEFLCVSDTEKMIKICRENNIFIPDEGRLSPLVELSLAGFLKALGQVTVVTAGHFGTSPQQMKSEAFLQPMSVSTPEIHTQDKSAYLSIYIDYHYLLVCQTKHSRSLANPSEYFEGFFADEKTSDLWGIGDLTRK